jgi:hypothetical protein
MKEVVEGRLWIKGLTSECGVLKAIRGASGLTERLGV